MQQWGLAVQRAPQAFKGDVTTAAGFFGKLESEPLGLSEDVNEAVNRLQCAYTALPCPKVNEELQCMLKWQAERTNERTRTCALVWALGIFPRDGDLHKRMEYLCRERGYSPIEEERMSPECQENSAPFSGPTTKLFEPASHKHTASSSSPASCSQAAELRRGWPEAWAAIKKQKSGQEKAQLDDVPAHRCQGAAGSFSFEQEGIHGGLVRQAAVTPSSALMSVRRQSSFEWDWEEAEWDWEEAYGEYGKQLHSDVIKSPALPNTLEVTAGAPAQSAAPGALGFLEFNPWNEWAEVLPSVAVARKQLNEAADLGKDAFALPCGSPNPVDRSDTPSGQQEPCSDGASGVGIVQPEKADLAPACATVTVAAGASPEANSEAWRSQINDNIASRSFSGIDSPGLDVSLLDSALPPDAHCLGACFSRPSLNRKSKKGCQPTELTG